LPLGADLAGRPCCWAASTPPLTRPPT